MDTEQKTTTPGWVRRHGLLPPMADVRDDDELVQGNRENLAIDRASGAALFMAQCLVKLAGDVGRLDDVPTSIRDVWGLPLIDEKERLCMWQRRHGDYDAFTQVVEIIRQLVEGVTTAGEILNKLHAFNNETLHRIMDMFLESREKLKKEKEVITK